MAVGVFDGFMEFNASGEFSTFIGANRVRVDPVELLWKRLSTRAQRSQMAMFTPTEFTNLDINDEGFIYATNGDRFGDTIKKLNAQGNDILRRTGYFSPRGDIAAMAQTDASRLIDIDVADSEIYSVLDSRRGRIFTYNGDGHFMYVFGGLGNQLGEFNAPSAIERVGDQFLVLDKALGEITLFETTEYGRTLNEAVRSYYRGDEEAAFALFQKSINMNANLEFAYSGIGKALLRQGKYAEAMKFFKQSKDQLNYSKAFLLHRKEVLREYFPAIMTGIVLIALGTIAFRKLRQWKGGRKRAAIEQ
jgi:tetratricopeptide (TPR) repeat protein